MRKSRRDLQLLDYNSGLSLSIKKKKLKVPIKEQLCSDSISWVCISKKSMDSIELFVRGVPAL